MTALHIEHTKVEGFFPIRWHGCYSSDEDGFAAVAVGQVFGVTRVSVWLQGNGRWCVSYGSGPPSDPPSGRIYYESIDKAQEAAGEMLSVAFRGAFLVMLDRWELSVVDKVTKAAAEQRLEEIRQAIEDDAATAGVEEGPARDVGLGHPAATVRSTDEIAEIPDAVYETVSDDVVNELLADELYGPEGSGDEPDDAIPIPTRVGDPIPAGAAIEWGEARTAVHPGAAARIAVQESGWRTDLPPADVMVDVEIGQGSQRVIVHRDGATRRRVWLKIDGRQMGFYLGRPESLRWRLADDGGEEE